MSKNLKYSQNFITKEQTLTRLVKKMNLSPDDHIIEIGTGKGHLTNALSKVCFQITSIELDAKLHQYSAQKLHQQKNVHLIQQDILSFPFPMTNSYKIVGNIPFQISTPIIRKIVFESHATHMYLIVEEGFAKRIQDTNRALSIFLQTHVTIRVLHRLHPHDFHPKPSVSSVLIQLKRHDPIIQQQEWKDFETFVHYWVRRDYRKLFTKNQWRKALQHAKVTNLQSISYSQIIELFRSYQLFNHM